MPAAALLASRRACLQERFSLLADAAMRRVARARRKSANEMRGGRPFPLQDPAKSAAAETWALCSGFVNFAAVYRQLHRPPRGCFICVLEVEAEADFLLRLITQRACPGLCVSADPALIQFDPRTAWGSSWCWCQSRGGQ